MAFWSGETLALKLPTLVDPFAPAAIDCAAYTLHVGEEVYVSPDKSIASPSRHTKQRLNAQDGFTIPPGQFAFLTTQETVEVPDDAIAFISIKARLKFSGLVNISGFHVDPGYKGNLVFSVLNAGPKPLHLTEGQPLFLIWYADLDRQTHEKKKPGDGLSGITPAMINGISGEILSLQSLSDKQRDLERTIVAQVQEQKTIIARLSTQVQIMLGLSLTLFGGLLLFALRTWLIAPTP